MAIQQGQDIGPMEAGGNAKNSMDSSNNRSHLLHNCGASFAFIAHKIVHRVKNTNGYLGAMIQTMAFIAGPFARLIEKQCLSILSIIDTIIFAATNLLLFFLPQLEPIFKKIDQLALFLNSMPAKFDKLLEDLASLLHLLSLSSNKQNGENGSKDKQKIKDKHVIQNGGHMLEDAQKRTHDDDYYYNETYRKNMKKEKEEVEKSCEEALEELEKIKMEGQSGNGKNKQKEESILALLDEGWQLGF